MIPNNNIQLTPEEEARQRQMSNQIIGMDMLGRPQTSNELTIRDRTLNLTPKDDRALAMQRALLKGGF